MIKKTIKFKDFNGTDTELDAYFNINEAEAIRINLIRGDGFQKEINAISASKDPEAVLEQFEELIRYAYGVRSSDGTKFYKNKSVFEDFKASGAFDQLFLDLLIGGADEMSAFVRGFITAETLASAEKMAKEQSANAQPRPESDHIQDIHDAAHPSAVPEEHRARLQDHQKPQGRRSADNVPFDGQTLGGDPYAQPGPATPYQQ